jgi:crotonobetaine/carnitine-CoA ligase
MSEVPCPLVAEPNPSVTATCGKPRAGVEVRLVDNNDCEVAQGEIGELIIRTDTPWAMNHGYNKAPEATAVAWWNGWFHTGDTFRTDKDGNYFFVDRFKDAIRRRGENISSFEVELEVAAHPAIREATAVSVPSESMARTKFSSPCLSQDGQTLDPVDLIGFLRPRMAHFMVPRFVRILADLPKTPTNKVGKYLLRKDGVAPDTFDSDAAGIVIKSEATRSRHWFTRLVGWNIAALYATPGFAWGYVSKTTWLALPDNAPPCNYRERLSSLVMSGRTTRESY